MANFAGYPFLDQNGERSTVLQVWNYNTFTLLLGGLAGDVSPCVVLRAPFQKAPNEGRKRHDAKHHGTIESGPLDRSSHICVA